MKLIREVDDVDQRRWRWKMRRCGELPKIHILSALVSPSEGGGEQKPNWKKNAGRKTRSAHENFIFRFARSLQRPNEKKLDQDEEFTLEILRQCVIYEKRNTRKISPHSIRPFPRLILVIKFGRISLVTSYCEARHAEETLESSGETPPRYFSSSEKYSSPWTFGEIFADFYALLLEGPGRFFFPKMEVSTFGIIPIRDD